ncbi:NAD(P)-binding protein [Dothidotthia symphoricarpi CBS 119687]|uniref:NAD(P)-binding protein n=1 Tax=Dothidotthia symphoricarpi CBS 119687 TaxID=1392245 RepID=A0A6A6A0R1_9PLEO|nr:NAD(P)-binding protein [Dothidotthia symphoricarpi CBS 119687]KAF2124547.1 NAD(P)-binding protein [Dothidotthia symphoricarpi CBS 119687]
MGSPPPPHVGVSFTPTNHAKIPSNIDPSSTTLPNPSVVVVTGAGKGLGYHISLAYAKAGASGISISSRTLSDLDTLEKEISKTAAEHGRKIEVLKSVCDVTSEESVNALEEEVKQKWGRVDVVMANAGIISAYVENGKDGESNLPVGLVQDDDWVRVLDINLKGTWRISKAFMPLLVASKDGPQTLICSTSIGAHSTDSELTPIAYNVSKLACNRLIEHVANDQKKDGVCAIALHPGGVVTPQTQNHTNAAWGSLLGDDEGLAGAVCVWLTKEKRLWLSGRYVSSNWDVGELQGMRERIVEEDLLKFRMAV